MISDTQWRSDGGGPTGRLPRAAFVKGRHIESCPKITLCKRNKINSVL